MHTTMHNIVIQEIVVCAIMHLLVYYRLTGWWKIIPAAIASQVKDEDVQYKYYIETLITLLIMSASAGCLQRISWLFMSTSVGIPAVPGVHILHTKYTVANM